MKIICISDLHGFLPEIKEECDLFLHAGDICPLNNHRVPYQRDWLLDNFNPWLDSIKAKYKCITFGNHDFIGEEEPNIKYSLKSDVLVDEVKEYDGIKVWGSPWTKRFFDWAFNMDPPELYTLHKSIPKCDIILTHGPPYGITDLCQDIDDPEQLINVGSPGLLERIQEINPKLVVVGHIHSNREVILNNGTIVRNASYVDNRYRPVNNYSIYEI